MILAVASSRHLLDFARRAALRPVQSMSEVCALAYVIVRALCCAAPPGSASGLDSQPEKRGEVVDVRRSGGSVGEDAVRGPGHQMDLGRWHHRLQTFRVLR